MQVIFPVRVRQGSPGYKRVPAGVGHALWRWYTPIRKRGGMLADLMTSSLHWPGRCILVVDKLEFFVQSLHRAMVSYQPVAVVPRSSARWSEGNVKQ